MVVASEGTLVTCDVPVKEFLLYLDQGQMDKFIIADLDDEHLFVHTRSVTFIKEQLDELYKKNQYSFMDAEDPNKK